MAKVQWTEEKIKSALRDKFGKAYRFREISPGYKSIQTLECRKHGEFTQKFSSLLEGRGCPVCCKYRPKSEDHRRKISASQAGIPKGPSPQRMTVKELKSRIRELHGNKFGLQFITSDLKTRTLTLVCKVHGKFEKGRNDILHSGSTGCPKCNGGLRLTQKEFLDRARSSQPKWISFRKTEYKNSSTNVVVTCRYHGDQEFNAGTLLYSKRICCAECNLKRIREKRIASGQYPDPKTADKYKLYRLEVRRLSNQAARKHHPNQTRSRTLHLDHVFSIKEGFRQGVPAKVVGHVTNLAFLTGRVNQSKSQTCGKTLKQLYKDYKDYEQT